MNKYGSSPKSVSSYPKPLKINMPAYLLFSKRIGLAMSTTSFLHNAFNIQGIVLEKTVYEGNSIIFHVSLKDKNLKCFSCKSPHVVKKGGAFRKLSNGRIGKKKSFIEIFSHRLQCKKCGKTKQASLPFSFRYKSYTRSFASQVLDLSKEMTMLAVSKYLGVSWKIIKEIQKNRLLRKYSRPNLKNISEIGIDEICIGKGHRYMTVVIDLATGIVVYMSEGKSADSLIAFWKRLKRAKARIKAVAMDMGRAYISSVTKNLPKAKIIFDHFHVVKLLNEKVSSFRRAYFNQIENFEEKKLLKGIRWLLLKNPENLDEQKGEKERLAKALEINKPLSTVYYMKESFKMFWSQESKSKASQYLKNWVKEAEISGIPMLKKFGYQMLALRFGLLSYYDYKISTGPLEGTNNKIKNIQRSAYGYRDKEFFMLKVYASHESKYKLVG